MMDSGDVARMEWLPEELVEVIAGYLTAVELVNCCAVSVRWREMFGRERLWRPHHDSALASYLETSQPVVQPGFLSPETLDSTLSAISPTRIFYMRERHLKNNWSCGNYKVEVTPNGFLNYYSRKIFYDNDYILEFFDHKITVWDLTGTPSFHSSYRFLLEHSDEVKPFVIEESKKIVIMQCGVVRVIKLNLPIKELQVTLLFSVEMPEKCPDVNDIDYLFKKCMKVSCTVVDNILVGAAYGVPEKAPAVHIWSVETGKKLMEDIFSPNMNKHLFTIKFQPCFKTKNVAIMYIFHGLEDDSTITGYRVLSLSQLKVFPFIKMYDNIIEEFNDLFPQCCAISSHYIAIGENRKVLVYNYYTSELIYEAGSFQGICFWRNYLVFQNDHVISVVDILLKNIVAQFEHENLPPSVVTDNAICIFQSQENFVSFVARRNLLNNKSKSYVSLYSFQNGRPLFINKACTKVVIGDCKHFIVVHFW